MDAASFDNALPSIMEEGCGAAEGEGSECALMGFLIGHDEPLRATCVPTCLHHLAPDSEDEQDRHCHRLYITQTRSCPDQPLVLRISGSDKAQPLCLTIIMDDSTPPPRPSLNAPPPNAPKGPRLDRQPTFTTVGSVYKADSVAPLHPPNRRARVQRYAPQPETRPPPKPAPPTLPKPALTRSPSIGAFSFQQYSPLRQNQDRAVTPEANQGQELLRAMGVPGDPRLRGNDAWPPSVAGVVSNSSADPYDGRLIGASDAAAAGGDQTDSDDVHPDGGDNAQISKGVDSLNVTALRSLASYPNKWQDYARRKLDRARSLTPAPRPAVAATTNAPRPIEPLPRFAHTYGLPGRGPIPPPSGPRGPPHPASRASMHRDGMYGQATDPGADLHRTGFSAVGHEAGIMAPGSGAFSALSQGPGAPQPLTAGPPGHRQFKASTFQGTQKALEESAQKAGQMLHGAPADYGFPNPIGYGRSPGHAGASHMPLRGWTDTESVGETFLDEGQKPSASSCPAADFDPANDKHTMIDTATPAAVSNYYPYHAGFLPNFDQNATLTPPKTVPVVARPPFKTDEQLAMYRAKVEADFYSGTKMLGKTSDTTIDGTEGGEPQLQGGKNSWELGDEKPRPAGYPHLSIQEANQKATAEHAAPLLNMVFDRLHNHIKEGSEKGCPSGFVEAPPHLIDGTPQGRKSFWGNTE